MTQEWNSLQNQDTAVVRWIFGDREPTECELILGELEQDKQQQREFAVFTRDWDQFEKREALCVRSLPGSIGRIIGWRSASGTQTSELLEEALHYAKAESLLRLEQLCALGANQTDVLLSQGFQLVTSLRQLCLPVSKQRIEESNTDVFCFVPAHRLGLEGFAAAIRASMAESQDIEDLAPLADYPDTDLIENFSNGQSFRQMQTWFALEYQSQHIGCLLTQVHPNKALEIVYLGLAPEFRGRNLASSLLGKAYSLALQNACELIVTAVDSQNIPAIRLYSRHGFSEYAGFDFLSVDLI